LPLGQRLGDVIRAGVEKCQRDLARARWNNKPVGLFFPYSSAAVRAPADGDNEGGDHAVGASEKGQVKRRSTRLTGRWNNRSRTTGRPPSLAAEAGGCGLWPWRRQAFQPRDGENKK